MKEGALLAYSGLGVAGCCGPYGLQEPIGFNGRHVGGWVVGNAKALS